VRFSYVEEIAKVEETVVVVVLGLGRHSANRVAVYAGGVWWLAGATSPTL